MAHLRFNTGKGRIASVEDVACQEQNRGALATLVNTPNGARARQSDLQE